MPASFVIDVRVGAALSESMTIHAISPVVTSCWHVSTNSSMESGRRKRSFPPSWRGVTSSPFSEAYVASNDRSKSAKTTTRWFSGIFFWSCPAM